MNKFSESITVLGGGLIGSLLGICLSNTGMKVKIYEKREDPRKASSHQGRSINLALSNRGIKTLQMAGVKEKVLQQTIPMKGRMVHDLQGNTSFQPYGQEGEVIYSASRDTLNNLLLTHAEESGVSIEFNSKCEDIKWEEKKIELAMPASRKIENFNYLFGTDGAFSVMRNSMLRRDHFNYQQEYLDYGYLELAIPSKEGKHQLHANALHIWPRQDFLLIALPNLDGSFTCTLFLPFQGINSFENISNSIALQDFFKKYFSDALDLMPDLNEDFYLKSPSSIIMIHCSPWSLLPHSLLLGDAAHAVVPFYGQGMNAGFEDIRLLVEGIVTNNSIEKSIADFNSYRKKETDAMGKLSLNNFIEMRDLVDDPEFLFRKKLESKIIKHFLQYSSLYTQVTFSDLPYSMALENGKKQDLMFKDIISLNISENWESEGNWNIIKKIVEKYFPSSKSS